MVAVATVRILIKFLKQLLSAYIHKEKTIQYVDLSCFKNKKREKLKDFASTYSDTSRYGRPGSGVLCRYSITISSAPTLAPLPPRKKKWEFHHNLFHTLKAKINNHKSVLNGINRKGTTSIQQKGRATNSPFPIKTNVHSTWKHSWCFLAQIRTKCSVSTPRLSVYRVTMYELPVQFTALTSREQAPHTQLKFFYVQKEIAY